MAFITINKAHFFHNLDVLCAKAGGKTKLMAVLKDNAYGHDLRLMASLASEYGLKRAAVKNIEEAEQIKNTTISEELALPPVKIHCSVLAEDAIKAAVRDYKQKKGLN